MGVDQLPFLPTRRSSLTLIPKSIYDDHSSVATRPINISTPVVCRRSSSCTHHHNKERASRRDLSNNCGGSSSLCSGKSDEEMSRRSGRDKDSLPRRKSRTHFTTVRQPPKSLIPSRSQSFEGIARRRLSPSLPTVQEFQRANFVHEDEQVLESFRRSRSWSDVRESRNQNKHTKSVRLSPRNRNRSVLVATIGRKNGGTGVVLTELAELSKSRRFDHKHNDHRLVLPLSSMHPTLDIDDVGIDKERELKQVSPITPLKTSQTSQERLQSTIQSVEEALYQSFNSKYVTVWPRQLAHNNNERDHAAMTGLVPEQYQVETIGDTKSMSHHVKTRRTELDDEFHNILGVPLLRNANESRPHSTSLLANWNDKVPSPRSITCMLPVGTTRPAFGDSDKVFGGNMALVTPIPKNMAAPISPKRVSSPLLIKRKSA
jgi:hypothetical protein